MLPKFLRQQLAFQKIRPLHVYLAISWIFTAAQGCMYYFLPRIAKRELCWRKGITLHFVLQLLTSLSIIVAFFGGYFGGREYLEFPPVMGVLIAASWVKNVAYIISMTELLIFGQLVFKFRKTLSEARKNFHSVSFRLLSFADLWIFLNLGAAIAISVPALNYYTHGTHITVAHAMGTTIGINTMLLFAADVSNILYPGSSRNNVSMMSPVKKEIGKP